MLAYGLKREHNRERSHHLQKSLKYGTAYDYEDVLEAGDVADAMSYRMRGLNV